MIPCAKLVVGHAVRIFEIAVDLAGFDSEHAARNRRMAGQTILPSGEKPILNSRASGSFYGYGFGDSRCHQICVGIVRAPFVARAVNGAVGVADEQACFKPPENFWI